MLLYFLVCNDKKISLEKHRAKSSLIFFFDEGCTKILNVFFFCNRDCGSSSLLKKKCKNYHKKRIFWIHIKNPILKAKVGNKSPLEYIGINFFRSCKSYKVVYIKLDGCL